MKSRHAGRILIPEKLLLEWLGFSGGKLHYIRIAEEYLSRINVLVEHHDLPEVEEAAEILLVTPAYHFSSVGKRISPKQPHMVRRFLKVVFRT